MLAAPADNKKTSLVKSAGFFIDGVALFADDRCAATDTVHELLHRLDVDANIITEASALLSQFESGEVASALFLVDRQSLDTVCSLIKAIRTARSGCEDFLLVASTEASLIAVCMEAGSDDFLQLPIDPVLLECKLRRAREQHVMLTLLKEQREAIERNEGYLALEQEVAKEVFDKIARDDSADMPNIKRWLSPIAVFNGDVFLAAPTPSGGLLVLLGDFTGHGLAAAIGAMPLAATFYGMAGKGFSMSDIIKEINTKLKDILPVSVFCCATVASIDFNQRKLRIWNAGLPDCYLLRDDNQDDVPLLPIPSKALPLGVVETRDLNIDVEHYNFDEGDRLYLLSDGLLEAPNLEGDQFGEERLIPALGEALTKPPKQAFEFIQDEVEAFIGEGARADDISLIEITGIDASEFAQYSESAGAAGVQHPVSWRFNYLVRPDSLRHQDPVPLLLHALMEVPALRKFSSQLYTIFTELYANALDHGLLQLSSALKHESEGFAEYFKQRESGLAMLNEGSVEFILDYQGDAQSGRLQVDVIDSGEGFDSASLAQQSDDVDSLHGRGIPLLRAICENVEYLGNGNHVRVIFSW